MHTPRLPPAATPALILSLGDKESESGAEVQLSLHMAHGGRAGEGGEERVRVGGVGSESQCVPVPAL